MKITTSGESHGKGLFAVIEGLPSNLKIDAEQIDYYLALRQGGYGRGGRQKIERDTVQIMSGVRNTLTLGSPVCLFIENADYKNWEDCMSPSPCDVSKRTLTKVRPGHADLTGVIKYAQSDARNVLERASARETAARVAAGSVCRGLLSELGVEICGYVKCVCGIEDEREYSFKDILRAKEEPLFMLDEKKQEAAMALIDRLRAEGDTAGGLCEVRVRGLKSGFGSCMTYEQKLDARLCAAAMSVQAIKGVEIGMGMDVARKSGRHVHDEIYYSDGFKRKTNNAGGIEGGMSNGEEIILRAAMKPIPTLMSGLNTVDYITREAVTAAGERSDVCAICACEVILESVIASALCQVVLERLGGDNMDEVKERYAALLTAGEA